MASQAGQPSPVLFIIFLFRAVSHTPCLEHLIFVVVFLPLCLEGASPTLFLLLLLLLLFKFVWWSLSHYVTLLLLLLCFVIFLVFLFFAFRHIKFELKRRGLQRHRHRWSVQIGCRGGRVRICCTLHVIQRQTRRHAGSFLLLRICIGVVGCFGFVDTPAGYREDPVAVVRHCHSRTCVAECFEGTPDILQCSLRPMSRLWACGPPTTAVVGIHSSPTHPSLSTHVPLRVLSFENAFHSGVPSLWCTRPPLPTVIH
eukprot:TRINITY_DN965_c0_g1_i2.p1 TRINITY_DN965_c0_g1~~TRINITY_DN965_c0_g1_i2.p1  ORF type:complete len:256 (-),score=32.35 TRINITY_DN965_c0_g1_i2:26-793(-)